jgi:hypothetical protein
MNQERRRASMRGLTATSETEMTTEGRQDMDWYFWKRGLGRDRARSWAMPAGVTPRSQVLLETADGAEAHAAWRLLSRHGYDTMWCPGPSGHHARECSLVRTGHCPLVDRADVIVSALDQNERSCAEVARHLDRGATSPAARRPVVVVTPRRAAEERTAALPHCSVVSGPLSSKLLLRSVSGVTPENPKKVSTAAR